jgi:hypothetical protein
MLPERKPDRKKREADETLKEKGPRPCPVMVWHSSSLAKQPFLSHSHPQKILPDLS